jgi:hypothetical protein
VSGFTTLACAVAVIVADLAGAHRKAAAAKAGIIAALNSKFPTSALTEPDATMVTEGFTKLSDSSGGLKDS